MTIEISAEMLDIYLDIYKEMRERRRGEKMAVVARSDGKSIIS
jgi:hypothetical protein